MLSDEKSSSQIAPESTKANKTYLNLPTIGEASIHLEKPLPPKKVEPVPRYQNTSMPGILPSPRQPRKSLAFAAPTFVPVHEFVPIHQLHPRTSNFGIRQSQRNPLKGYTTTDNSGLSFHHPLHRAVLGSSHPFLLLQLNPHAGPPKKFRSTTRTNSIA